MFSLAASMHFCSLMYGICCVSEPSVVNADRAKKPSDDRSLLADFFDKAHVVETFRVAFKNGARQRRLRVIMLIIVVMVVDGPLYGELNATATTVAASQLSKCFVCAVTCILSSPNCSDVVYIECD